MALQSLPATLTGSFQGRTGFESPLVTLSPSIQGSHCEVIEIQTPGSSKEWMILRKSLNLSGPQFPRL